MNERPRRRQLVHQLHWWRRSPAGTALASIWGVHLRRFRSILRHAFRASLTPPIAIGAVGCDASIDPSVCATLEAPADAGISGDGGSQACVSYTLHVTGAPARCGLYPIDCHQGAPVTSQALCDRLCHLAGAGCALSGANDVWCTRNCAGGACCGRRPQGLTLARAKGKSATGRWLADLAAREEASVTAFEILAAELVALRAPGHLIEGAKRAARDEVRHARAMGGLARRYGGERRRPRIERRALRCLDEVAVENVAEGCVRETFGALVGMWQAAFAADPRARRVMRGIARDESRHAALSWEIAQWAERKVDADVRVRLTESRARAVDALSAELTADPDPAVVRHLGVPSRAHVRALFEQLQQRLWS